MGEFAMDALAAQYNIFFNFSASIASEASNLRNGFIPLVRKAYLNRGNMLGLIKFIMTLNRKEEIKDGKISFGHFGNILVSNQPKPKEMADLVNKPETNNSCFKLLQNEQFFIWRYRNNSQKYAFYFFHENDVLKGYVVVNVSNSNKRGYISDYSEIDYGAVDKIIEFIIKAKHFDIISIYNYSVTDNLSYILNKHQFKDKGLIRLIERRKNGEIPLFIRPVKRDYVERDLFVKGIDIQKIEGWRLKEICSDGA
jgi:hypothetical protein